MGIKESFSFSSFFPDYTMAGVPDWAAYILSAIIGVAISIIIFRIISASMKNRTNY